MSGVPDSADRSPRTGAERAAFTTATFLGTGYAPFASGTVATAAAVPVQLALALLPPPPWRAAAQVAALIVVAVLGVITAGIVERRLGVHDPSEVVIDEVAGYLLTMLLIPPSIVTVACGFVLFRLLDIVKPWPAGAAERIGGGRGIMADDLVCGLYANLALHGGIWLLR